MEVIRAIYERFNQGDFRASNEALDPHVVLVLPQEFGPYLVPSSSSGPFEAKVVRIESFVNRAEALEAAGLRE